jgi:hypothetical protein
MLLPLVLIPMGSRFQGSYFEEAISSISAGRVPGPAGIAAGPFRSSRYACDRTELTSALPNRCLSYSRQSAKDD